MDSQNFNTETNTGSNTGSNIESNKTIDPDNSINIIEKFLQIYNAKNKTVGSMFENVDIKNPSDTNDRMEQFYEYMQEHAMLNAENAELTDVYPPNEKIDGSNDRIIYALTIGKYAKVKYISLSYISLLYVGTSNPNVVGKDWSIISLDS